jgi:hypothetical protein
MAQDPHSVNPAAYNKLVGRAVLRGIRLTETRFEMKPEALELDHKVWKRSLSGELLDHFTDAERGLVLGSLLFEVTFRHRRKRILHAAARYVVTYHVNDPGEPDVGRLFVERVGRVAAYPFFRVIVATLSSQAGVQLPPLPMISLQPRSVKSAANFEPTDEGLSRDATK